jgi:hypothetical protein
MMTENHPRVLMLSHRNIANKILSRCSWYEFEDVVREIEDVEMLAPVRSENFEKRYRWAARVGRRIPIALNPGVPATTLERKYDLFFTSCALPSDLLYVNAVKNWRESCRTAVCWIDEMYPSDMRYGRWFTRVISQFDHVFFSCAKIIGALQSVMPGRCHFLLPGVDAAAFSPAPDFPERFIDILSIGRRSERIHERLVRAAEDRRWLYHYDTISGFGCKYGLTASDTGQHRRLLAALAKRSRYFLVNPGKFDLAEHTGGEPTIGSRYFEGAAAGTIMIGSHPDSEEFQRAFPGSDPVIRPGSDPEAFVAVMDELSRQPERRREMRKSNIATSLRLHDWAHRWEEILRVAGFAPGPRLEERKRVLASLAGSAAGAVES